MHDDDLPPRVSKKDVQRQLFTGLFRREVAAHFDVVDEPRKVMAFLKRLDWDDPHIVDQVVRIYIDRIAHLAYQATHPRLKNDPNLTVSWGSPETNDADKIARPNLRVMVGDIDTNHERYILTFTPRVHEEKPGRDTHMFLSFMRQLLIRDLGLDMNMANPHPIVKATDIKLGKVGRLVGTNLYENEGKTWDLNLPADQVKNALRDIISTGKREMSFGHIPPWTHEL